MDNRIISVSMWFHIPSTLPTVKSIIVIQIKIYVEIFLSKNTGKCTAVKTIAKHGKKKKKCRHGKLRSRKTYERNLCIPGRIKYVHL